MADITGGSDDEFWVTLPSNSNAKQFKNNSPSTFKVHLRNPIDLGSSDSAWEVALLSTQYTHNWYNFREDCCIRFLVKIPNLRPKKVVAGSVPTQASTSVDSNSVVTDASSSAADSVDLFYRDDEYGWHYDDYTAADHFVLSVPAYHLFELGVDTSWVYYKTTIRRGYFTNVRELGKEICRQFARAFASHDVHLHFHLDYETGFASFTASRAKVVVLLDSLYLATLLGMETRKLIDQDYKGSAPTTTNYKVFLMKVAGTAKPRLDVVNSLYVYSDITKYQAVGDVEAPLLGIVPVQGDPGSRLYWSFNPLCYLPLNKTYIQEIEMRLCTDEGVSVPFAAGSDNVVCCLRFRKTRHSRLL